MKYQKAVFYWLIIGLIMVFIQILVGGITRLTESGLSITKWELVSGIVPPLTKEAWIKEFDTYKETPQYKEVNEGMTLSDFKFIYFWEYIHRFWARLMGFVFIIPFLFFYRRKWIDSWLYKRLGILIILAALAASFGWIMVASGLIDRPWVNAYKLSVHLSLALCVYGYLFWTILLIKKTDYNNLIHTDNFNALRNRIFLFFTLLCVQIFLGGMMSGMKIAVVYPTWPDMNGVFFPDIIFNAANWKRQFFINYDSNEFMPALVHFLHRGLAYLVFLFGLYISAMLIKLSLVEKLNKNFYVFRNAGIFLSITLFIQMVLGILTVLNSKGTIPIGLGVMHQAGAVFLLSVGLYCIFITKSLKN